MADGQMTASAHFGNNKFLQLFIENCQKLNIDLYPLWDKRFNVMVVSRIGFILLFIFELKKMICVLKIYSKLAGGRGSNYAGHKK